MSTYDDPFEAVDTSQTNPDNATTDSSGAVNDMQAIMNTTPSEQVNAGASNSGVTQETPQYGTDVLSNMLKVISPNAVGGQARASAAGSSLGATSPALSSNLMLFAIIALVIYFLLRK